MDIERRVLREIGLAAAIGAALGTVLAVVFGQWWLIGTLCGGLIGGIAYHPAEILSLLKQRAGTFVSYVFVAPIMLLLFLGVIGISVVVLAAYLACGLCLLYLIVITLMPQVVWSPGVDAMAVMTCLMFSGMLVSFYLIFIHPDTADEVSQLPVWRMPLSRFLGKLVRKPVLVSPTIARSWFQAYGLFRVGATVALSLFGPLFWVAAALFSTLLYLIDAGVTVVMECASTKRLAAMEGALLGGLGGYWCSVLLPHPYSALAVVVAAAIGFAAGPPLYMLRQALDEWFPRPQPAYDGGGESESA